MTALDYLARDILWARTHWRPSFWTLSPDTYRAVKAGLVQWCDENNRPALYADDGRLLFASIPIHVEPVFLA